MAILYLMFFLMLTFITEYTISIYSVDQSMAWMAPSLFTFGCLPARFVVGRYMDIWGRKRTLYGSLAVFLLVMAVNTAPIRWGLYLFFRFLNGVAFGVASTIMPAAAMDLIPDARKAEGYSYFSLGNTVSSAIGPYLGIFLNNVSSSPKAMFVACSGMCVLAILIAVPMQIPEATPVEDKHASFREMKLSDFYEKKALPLCLVIFLVGMAYSGISTYLNSYSIELAVPSAPGTFYLIYALTIILIRPHTGKQMDKRGENIVMYPSLAAFIVSFAFLALAWGGGPIYVAGALVGMGYGITGPAIQTVFAKITPKHRVAVSLSNFFISIDAGIAIGPLIVGNVLHLLGFRGVYWLMGGVSMLALAVYHLVHGRKAAVYQN